MVARVKVIAACDSSLNRERFVRTLLGIVHDARDAGVRAAIETIEEAMERSGEIVPTLLFMENYADGYKDGITAVLDLLRKELTS